MKKTAISGIVLPLVLTSMLTMAVSAQQNNRIGEVIYSVPSPEKQYTGGLAWDGAALWTTGALDGMIYRFDPFTDTVLASFQRRTKYLRDLAWDGTNLWVTNWDYPRMVYKLNPIDGSVITYFSPPFSGHPDGLAWDGDYLWIGEEDGKIYRVDPSTGQAIYSFSVPWEYNHNPRGLAWDGEHIWAGYQNVGLIKEHDITTGNALTTFASPSPWGQQGLAWDGRYLWSTGGDNYIYQINVGVSISATVGFKAWGRGKWIPAYIELPEGLSVSDINISTVKLNDTISIGKPPPKIRDYNKDDIPDLMVKFNRDELLDWLAASGIPKIGNYYDITLTIAGKLTDDSIFEGSQHVRILDKGK